VHQLGRGQQLVSMQPFNRAWRCCGDTNLWAKARSLNQVRLLITGLGATVSKGGRRVRKVMRLHEVATVTKSKTQISAHPAACTQQPQQQNHPKLP
jgi:hypothetical protein